jgi:hypothetical protein
MISTALTLILMHLKTADTGFVLICLWVWSHCCSYRCRVLFCSSFGDLRCVLKHGQELRTTFYVTITIAKLFEFILMVAGNMVAFTAPIIVTILVTFVHP